MPDLKDLFILFGLLLAGCGIALIYFPAGLIFVGLILMIIGIYSVLKGGESPKGGDKT